MATVSQLIDNAIERTEDVTRDFEKYAEYLRAQSLVDFSGVAEGIPDSAFAWPFSDTDLEELHNLVSADLPETDEIDFTSIPDVGSPPSVSVREAKDIAVTQEAVQPPTINIPTAPNVVFPTAPDSAATPVMPVLPVAPTLNLPDEPTLTDVVLPSPPSFDMPLLTVTAPDATIAELDTQLEYSEPVYESAIMTALSTGILSDLQDENLGISLTTENAAWDRARDRLGREMQSAEDAVASGFAARGYSLPSGAELDARLTIVQEGVSKLSEFNRDMAIDRVKLAVEAKRFAQQTGAQLETVLIDLHDKTYMRALDVAKALANHGVALFNARVQRVKTQLDVFKAHADVFESKIRAISASTDVYKTEIEGAKVSMEARKSHLEIYEAKIRAQETLLAIYSTQMDAAKTAMDVEKTKLGVKQSEVEGYRSVVQGKIAELQGYKTRIDGERAKVDMYSAQVGAQKTIVDGARSMADMQSTLVGADIDKAKLDQATYDARIKTFMARLESEKERIKTVAANNGLTLKKYETKIKGVEAYTRARNQFATTSATVSDSQQKLFLEEARTKLAVWAKQQEIRVGGRESLTNIYGGIVESASSALSTLISMSEEAS